jgi:3-oxoacyl-[acyl-carrier-protein] synthase II
MGRIAITGIGMADSLGSNTAECWDNYLHKDHHPEDFREPHPAVANVKCFYADHEWDRPTDELTVPIPNGTYNGLYKANKMTLHTVSQALKDIPPSQNVGVVYSCLNPEGPTKLKYAMWLGGMGKRLKPRQQLQHLQSYASGLISTHYDFNGASLTLGAACATSLYIIDYAIKLLEDDEYDYVVAGAAEGSNDLWGLSYFNTLGAIGTHSAPFDKNRDGFIMGEGSGTLVLEKEENAIARGAKIYGYIHGVGKSNDAAKANPTSPDPDGIGIKLSMTRAMKKGVNMAPYAVGTHWGNELAFVNAHATSTPAGDDAEYNAIQHLFPGVPVTSFKSKVGHTMGASGVLELIYTLMALNNGTVPPNHNIKDCDLKHVPTEPAQTEKRFAIKNGLAFGGKNATVLIEKGPTEIIKED